MSASTRAFGSSAGKLSGSSPSSPLMETSGCSPTTSALRSQCCCCFFGQSVHGILSNSFSCTVCSLSEGCFVLKHCIVTKPQTVQMNFHPLALTACLLARFIFSLVAIPVYVKHNITFREGSSQGRFDLTLGPKQTMGKAVESVLVSSQLPRGVLNANLNPSQGTYTFDPVTKVLRNESECVYMCTFNIRDLPAIFSGIERVRNCISVTGFFKVAVISYCCLHDRCCLGMSERSTHRSFPAWKAPWACRPGPPNLTRTPPSTSSSRSNRWPSQVRTHARITTYVARSWLYTSRNSVRKKNNNSHTTIRRWNSYLLLH